LGLVGLAKVVRIGREGRFVWVYPFGESLHAAVRCWVQFFEDFEDFGILHDLTSGWRVCGRRGPVRAFEVLVTLVGYGGLF